MARAKIFPHIDKAGGLSTTHLNCRSRAPTDFQIGNVFYKCPVISAGGRTHGRFIYIYSGAYRSNDERVYFVSRSCATIVRAYRYFARSFPVDNGAVFYRIVIR